MAILRHSIVALRSRSKQSNAASWTTLPDLRDAWQPYQAGCGKFDVNQTNHGCGRVVAMALLGFGLQSVRSDPWQTGLGDGNLD